MYVNGKPVFIRIYLLVCVVFTVISTVITSALVLFSETTILGYVAIFVCIFLWFLFFKNSVLIFIKSCFMPILIKQLDAYRFRDTLL